MESEVAAPLKPKFYRRYVDDIFNRCRENAEDILFKRLNNYHQHFKLTTEINSTKFLDGIINLC